MALEVPAASRRITSLDFAVLKCLMCLLLAIIGQDCLPEPGQSILLKLVSTGRGTDQDTDNLSWAESANYDPAASAIRGGKAQLNQDVTTSNVSFLLREVAQINDLTYGCVFPLIANSRVFGALSIYSDQEQPFASTEIALLEELCEDLSYGVHAFRLCQRHDQALLRLQSVQMVASMVELLDPYTAGRQRRVAELAAMIARHLGLSDSEVQGIHLAGVIHDIGKIQVAEATQGKPGEEQCQLLRMHPVAGYNLLKDIDFPWPIADMVHQHHERLDGSGYPQGLKGEQILLGARILAVADVVEVMALNRPYREGQGVPAALQELRRGRGRIYDAQVCDICISLLQSGEFSFS